MTRWLDDDERRTWMALSILMSELPHALDTALQRDAGISRFEYYVLAPLSERSDRTMRMSDLAVIANGSLSRLSHVARRLEVRGLLRREPDPTDGRYTNAILTDAGQALVEAAAPAHVAAVRRLVFDAVPDHGALRDSALAIVTAIDPVGWPPPGGAG